MNIRIALSGLLILLIGFGFNSLKFKHQQVTFHLRSTPPGVGVFSDLDLPIHPIYNLHSQLYDLQKVDSRIERFRKQWGLVGCALAIVKNEKLVFAKGYGYADQEKQIPVQPFHLFRIASVSKLFTAIAIMHLVEAGELRLADRVFGAKGILNDSIFLAIEDPLAYKIEVQHLLRHTGGWRNQLRRDPMFAPQAVARVMEVASPPSLETIIQFMLAQKGYFEPGSLYDYSNFGYCVLGKIIEKKTGMPYEAYLQQHILAPMGIRNMHLTSNTYEGKDPLEVKY
ncbi:MAG: serine hydrolase domain-containing protein, partial [Bacteroidota bacterium]